MEDYTILKETGKYMAIGCTHGDLLHEPSFNKFMARRAAYKPKHMLHLGDAFEFTALRKGATDDEQRISIDVDISWGLWLLEEIFSGIKGQRWFLRGNHCERLWQMKDKGSAIGREFAEEKIYEIESFLEDRGIQMKPYCSSKGVIKINDTLFMHGYGHGINAAKDHIRAYHNHAMFCHTHRAEHAVGTGWPEPLTAVNIGCMLKLLPQYASRGVSTLSWTHGFGQGEFMADGTATRELVVL